MSYTLKYTGAQIDAAIDKINELGPVEDINDAIDSIENKVDKVEGAGLITDKEREKLESITNADWGENNQESLSYIKNRTHSYRVTGNEQKIYLTLDTKGKIISYVGQDFTINGVVYHTDDVCDVEFILQDDEGYDRFTVLLDSDGYHLYHTQHFGSDRYISVCPMVIVSPLSTAYIPDSIARTKDVVNKANADGRYSKLTSGFAENIVGDGSATEEMFSLRPTAGEDRNVANTTYIDGERNEAARITALKGSSVVWNSQAASVEEIANFRKNIFSFDSTTNAFSVLNNTSASGLTLSLKGNYTRPDVGHKYFVAIDGEYDNNAVVHFGSQSYSQKISPSSPQIVECVKAGYFYFYIFGASNTTITAGTTFVINNVLLCDLTRMFGAGNEPTTAEEFYQRIALGIDVNAYNEGEIIDGHYKALLSTAFNQFNGAYARVCAGDRYHITGDITSLGFTPKEGGALVDIALVDNKYTPSENGYIYATGDNICIHLCWAEYAHIEDMYEPYKPFERDLSWIKRYFPEGMRSAGSARAEIRYNAAEQRWEAVQRVGVVDLGSLNWDLSGTNDSNYKRFESFTKPIGIKTGVVSSVKANTLCSKYVSGTADNTYYLKQVVAIKGDGLVLVYDPAYTDPTTFKAAMAGVMLHYELAEPIITPVTEEVSLDYDCSDYGSEELISDGVSAPLVADIVYAPNALATLKQVPDILRRLAALEAKSVGNINIEEL